jgi:hypothetical protein
MSEFEHYRFLATEGADQEKKPFVRLWVRSGY